MSSPLASLNNTFEEQEKNDEEQEQNEQKDHLLWLQTNWHNTLCKPTKIQKMKNQLRQSNYELNELSQRVETIGATFKIISLFKKTTLQVLLVMSHQQKSAQFVKHMVQSAY